MPGSYADFWFPVLIQILIAIAVAGGMIGISALLGHRVADTAKSTPYESGMKPVGTARERFSVSFYLVAMVFIVFDIEAIFLYPWATVYRDLGLFGFWEMLLFIALVLGGFFYIYKKGVLNWSIDQEKREQRGRSERAA
jgi:NADH-quinone oxidoreductase subunit A